MSFLYDPTMKTLHLSSYISGNRSVTAKGVADHEAGCVFVVEKHQRLTS